MSSPLTREVTAAQLKTAIAETDKLVIVDFWAPWCGPCRMVAPVLEQIAGDMDGKLTILKVNIDEEMQLAMEHGVNSIPTMLLIKGGNVVERIVGARGKADMMKLIEPHMIG